MNDVLWIDERDAMALHLRLLALNGGMEGVRDGGLLQSALARPRSLRAYGGSPDMAALAGAYTGGIIQNPPFIDGNKRAGLMTGVVFLETNGCRFHASEEAATHAIMNLSAGNLDEAAFTAWLRSQVTTPKTKRGLSFNPGE